MKPVKQLIIQTFKRSQTTVQNYRSGVLQRLLSASLLLTLASSCSSIRLPKQLADTDFRMDVVEQSTGVYTISGETDLPETSEIAVAAVRYLERGEQHSQSPAKPTYSILDYQIVQVNQGKWKASLNLQQPIANRSGQEIWQIEQARLGLSLKPADEVIFMATLVSSGLVDQLQALEQQLSKQSFKLDRKLIYTTAGGQQYVQVNQLRKVPVPQSSDLASKSLPEEINGGWGNRFLMPPESTPPYRFNLPNERKTNAPSTPQEFLR